MDLGKLDWVLQSGTRYGGSVLELEPAHVQYSRMEAKQCGQRTLWRRTLKGSSVGVAACLVFVLNLSAFVGRIPRIGEGRGVYCFGRSGYFLKKFKSS